MITEFTSPSGGQPYGIGAGPDGNVWYTKQTAVIGRITPAGVITEFPVPTAGGVGITTGPDGNLWYVKQSQAKIGRITPAGVATEFTALSGLFVTTGADGNLWYTTQNNSIARFNIAGVIAPTPTLTPTLALSPTRTNTPAGVPTPTSTPPAGQGVAVPTLSPGILMALAGALALVSLLLIRRSG